MTELFVVASLLAVTGAVMLLLRLRRADAALDTAVAEWPTGDPTRRYLLESLRKTLDDDLLASADYQGWSDLTVECREQHDNCRHVDDLLRALSKDAAQDDLRSLETQTKRLYQLQASLNLSDARVAPMLDSQAERFRSLRFMDHVIQRVERVPSNAHLDRATMRPLTPGTRVRQPLGFILRGSDDRVLVKAKVNCR